MKSMKTVLIAIFVFTVSTTMAYAEKGTGCPEALQSGKEIFNSPEKLGSTTNTSCAKCHPDGKGLKGVVKKKRYDNKAELANMINMCIEKAVNGKKLAPDSKEMKYLSAYIRSIGKKGQGSEMKGEGSDHKGSGHKGHEHEGSGHK